MKGYIFMQGFIKAHRQLLNWEWYTDIPVKVLFLHFLLKANHRPDKWRGIEISIGQFVTSLEHLAKETGLTVQQVRTAIKKLKSTQEITYQSTSHNSIITINNWDKWQATNTKSNIQITSNQHSNNIQITTNKNIEEVKNNKEKKKSLSISKKEREILKNYIKKQSNVKNVDAYLKTLISNGDYSIILNEEKERIKRIELKKNNQVEEILPEDNHPIDFIALRGKFIKNYKRGK